MPHVKSKLLLTSASTLGALSIVGLAHNQNASADQIDNDPQYQIKAGDTLYQIAEDHNTTVDTLAKINNISNPNLIYADAYLKLDVNQQTQTNSQENQAKPTSAPQNQSAQATVQAQTDPAPATQPQVSSTSEDQALQTLIMRESSGNVNATNGQYYGLGQLSPQARATYGGNTANYQDQLQAMKAYIADRYGTAQAALAHHYANNWY